MAANAPLRTLVLIFEIDPKQTIAADYVVFDLTGGLERWALRPGLTGVT